MENNQGTHGSYKKFFAMIGTSMVAMFFLMYLNSYEILGHAWFSETRLFMTLIMGAAMMVIMLAFMLRDVQRHKFPIWQSSSALAYCYCPQCGWYVSQITVTGVDYMEGMIPHHSIAILTSERARIDDPRVRKLADEIIKAQRREIKEMEWLIADIRAHGVATNQAEADARPVPAFSASPPKLVRRTHYAVRCISKLNAMSSTSASIYLLIKMAANSVAHSDAGLAPCLINHRYCARQWLSMADTLGKSAATRAYRRIMRLSRKPATTAIPTAFSGLAET